MCVCVCVCVCVRVCVCVFSRHGLLDTAKKHMGSVMRASDVSAPQHCNRRFRFAIASKNLRLASEIPRF